MGSLVYLKLFHSHLKSFEQMPPDLVGKIVMAMIRYNMTGKIPEMGEAERYVFVSAFKEEIDHSKAKYQERCEKNRKAAKTRWEKRFEDAVPEPETPDTGLVNWDDIEDPMDPPKVAKPVGQSDSDLFSDFDEEPVNIQKTIDHWNSKKNLPECVFISANIPEGQDIRSRISAYGQEQVQRAIDNLSELWEDVEPTYRPKSFRRFALKSLDVWVDSANPKEAYGGKKKKKADTDYFPRVCPNCRRSLREDEDPCELCGTPYGEKVAANGVRRGDD